MMSYQDWIEISESLKTTAYIAEMNEIAFCTPGYIGAPPCSVTWIDRRTYQEVSSPWLKLTPLTQEDINYTVLVEVYSGELKYSFPAYTVPSAGYPSNSFQGTQGNDNLLGTAQSNTLVGFDGRDRLTGYSGDDTLKGGNGNDRLVGGDGNDTLWGGSGNNVMVGGRGRDLFVLEQGPGKSMIRDFRDRQDKLGLLPGTNFKNLDIEQRGNRTIISKGNDILAILNGVRENQISAADFMRVSSI